MNLYSVKRFYIYRLDVLQIISRFRVINGSYLRLVFMIINRRVTSDFVVQTIDGHFRISKGGGYDQVYTLNPFLEFQLSKYLEQSKADVFIDIGSFMGVHAIAWSRLNPESHVYAIEPAPLNYEKLLLNVELNKTKNISCLNFAAGSSLSTANFPKLISSKLSLLENKGDSKIPVKRIDDSIEINVFKDKDVLIKIDVEGSELGVIHGLSRILKSGKSIGIVVEILDKNSFEDIAELLGEYEITYVRKVSGTNYIFER